MMLLLVVVRSGAGRGRVVLDVAPVLVRRRGCGLDWRRVVLVGTAVLGRCARVLRLVRGIAMMGSTVSDVHGELRDGAFSWSFVFL